MEAAIRLIGHRGGVVADTFLFHGEDEAHLWAKRDIFSEKIKNLACKLIKLWFWFVLRMLSLSLTAIKGQNRDGNSKSFLDTSTFIGSA